MAPESVPDALAHVAAHPDSDVAGDLGALVPSFTNAFSRLLIIDITVDDSRAFIDASVTTIRAFAAALASTSVAMRAHC